MGPDASPDTAAARRATRIVFFIAGFAIAAWAPLVPFAKARASLDEATLGLLLLCLGVGSLAAMPVTGVLVAAQGCRRVAVCATVLVGAALPLLASVSTVAALGLALALFGVGIGALDVAINVQAVAIQRAAGRPLMSGFHGLYSAGGIAGAGGMSALLTLGVAPEAGSLAVAAVTLAALAFAVPGLLRRTGGPGGPAFGLPRGAVLFLGVLCFTMYLVEGAALDWSAVFLAQDRAVPPARAGFAFAAFALAMTIVRFAGDRIVARLGGRRTVLLGGFVGAAGLGLAVLAPAWEAALLGFAFLGAGCANIVPVLFTALGRQRSMPEAAAVPAMTTLGYAGVLAGPGAIGFLAQATSLPAVLLVLALMLAVVALAGRWLP